MKCYLSRLRLCPLDCCSGASFCFIPYSFLFQSTSFSAVQPHSHSSSLSSVELVSASDDIHRFSAQVMYLVNSEHLYLQGDANCFSLQREHAQTAWECLLTSLSKISKVFPELSVETEIPGMTNRVSSLHNSFHTSDMNNVWCCMTGI